jgi:hypothetical protein
MRIKGPFLTSMEAQERAAMLLLKKIVPFGFEGIAAQLPQSRSNGLLHKPQNHALRNTREYAGGKECRLLEAKKGLRNLV